MEVMFFLGAGASVEAGVPDTYQIVEQFKQDLEADPEISQTVGLVLTTLEKWAEKQQPDQKVDVELLLEVLEKLRHRDQEVLLRFFKTSDYLLSGYGRKDPIDDKLRDFIKRKAIVEATKIAYMEPFLRFIQDIPSLEIFSVNYDTAIEQFCSVYKKDLTDGFDFRWTPKSFENGLKIRLYKLHGSITWYRTDGGEYVKIPIRTDSDAIELVTNERARSLILYPMRKWQYTEPLIELLMMLKQRLEVVKTCIVVGYSFRDEHITRLFWDAAQKNRNLHLILVGPHAPEIYRDRLEFYPDTVERGQVIPSSLHGRVVCLPYKFRTVFPSLRVIQQSLDHGLEWEETARKNKLYGSQDWVTNMKYAVSGFIEAEHIDKVDQLFSQGLDWDSFQSDLEFQLHHSYKMWFSLVSRRIEASPPSLWGARFISVLFRRFGPETLDLKFVAQDTVELDFRVDSEPHSAAFLIRPLTPLVDWSRRMVRLLEENVDPRQKAANHAIGELLARVHPWERGVIPLEQYKIRIESEEDVHSRKKVLDALGSSEKIAVCTAFERSKLERIYSAVESSVKAPSKV